MWVRMLRGRDYTPRDDRRTTTAYPVGWEGSVRRAWGDEMVADGDAVEISAPSRSEAQARRPLTPAQTAALDGDGDGRAGGSLPKDKR